MAEEGFVFGLRFGSNPDLMPGKQDIDQFLLKPKRKGPLATHGHDLASFRELVRLVAEYDRDELQENQGQLSLRDRMFYSVLSYSSLFSPLLLSTVELYKYYLDEFITLDVRKPQAFITAAQREMADLNPRKKQDADKLNKLEHLIRDRENFIKTLKKRSNELPRELLDIMAYIRDNIARISGRCEKAIVILVQLALEGSEERRLIGDIKTEFEQALKEEGDFGAGTPDKVDGAEQDLSVLSKEITALMREDVYALSSLYEAIQEHTKAIAERLSLLLAETADARAKGLDAERELLSRGEEALISLLSDLRLTFKLIKPVSKTGHLRLLQLKREAMLASFQEHARRERRTRRDRRSGRDRRKFQDPDFSGPEMRSGAERRTGKGRRRT